MLKEILKRKENPEKVKPVLDETEKFLHNLENKFPTLEKFLKNEKNVLYVRKSSIDFVKKYLKNFNKWNVRELGYKLFDNLKINMEEDTSIKLIFLLFTDAVSELKPEAVPLVFFYNDYPLVKKHGIILDFNIMPFLIQTVEELSPEKKHKLVLKLYNEKELLINGISKHISELNFFILNLLDKVLYKEIIPFEDVIEKKAEKFEPNKETLKLIIKAVFSALTEKYLHQKEAFSGLLDKKQNVYFSKIKNYIKKNLEDKDEIIYLKETAKADEESTENRVIAVRSYENQKNVFDESLRRKEIPDIEKIENIFWLLGIEHINPVLLLRYYDTDDILYFIHDTFKQAQDEGFLTEDFKKQMRYFLLKLFQYPYISKGFLNKKILDKPINLLYENDFLLKGSYLYFTRRYDEFLEIENHIREKTQDIKLKKLLAGFYTNKISKEDLSGWLSLESSPEGQFLYHLFTGSLHTLPENNEYKYIADLYLVKADKNDIIKIIGEEGLYTLLLRILGFYPYEKTLLNLADIKFSTS
jgi:hypothetical protein